MIAVVRLRSGIGKKKEVVLTLDLLRLSRKMHCVLINETPEMKGMIQKVKDNITWGNISDEVLLELINKRGRKVGNKRLTEEEAKKVFDDIKAGKKMKDLDIKPVFRLSPPSKGLKKSIKQQYPKGELGNRKEAINDLLKRMI